MDQEETYFRIYDSQRYLTGYFDPAYGEDATEEEIEQMLKSGREVPGGYLVVPMIKFGLFDSDLNIDIGTLQERFAAARAQLERWSHYMKFKRYPYHSIRISHTDQDMLTMSIPVRFPKPTSLHRRDLEAVMSPVMDSLQRQGLI